LTAINAAIAGRSHDFLIAVPRSIAMTTTPKRIWVLVAESSRARVHVWNRETKRLEAVEGLDWSEPHPHARDINSERPGRVRESVGAARHAVEPHTDPVDIFEARFAKQVLNAVDQRLAAGAFDRLVLVAGPETLGRLRGMLSPKLAKVATVEVGKDLAHLTSHDLTLRLVELGAL
jgi:protein required for attachment to host cells